MNVKGISALQYMIESMHDVPLHHFVLASSCVTSLPGFENSVFEVNTTELQKMCKMDTVLGLAEVIDFPGVIHHSPRRTGLIATTLKQNQFIQGHGVKGTTLSTYLKWKS